MKRFSPCSLPLWCLWCVFVHGKRLKSTTGTADRKSPRKTRRVPTLGASLARLCIYVLQQFFLPSASTSTVTTPAVAAHVSLLKSNVSSQKVPTYPRLSNSFLTAQIFRCVISGQFTSEVAKVATVTLFRQDSHGWPEHRETPQITAG